MDLLFPGCRRLRQCVQPYSLLHALHRGRVQCLPRYIRNTHCLLAPPPACTTAPYQRLLPTFVTTAHAILGTSYLYSATSALGGRLAAAVSIGRESASRSLRAARSSSSALLSLVYGVLTFALCECSRSISTSRYFSLTFRSFVADFGAALAVGAVSLLSLTRAASLLADVPRLACDATTLGRPLLVPLWSLPLAWRVLAAVPALFLAILFFLDQNITVRTVNSPGYSLVPRATYHLDLLVLGTLTGLVSICGLPWMCAATVESINHIRSLTMTRTSRNGGTTRASASVSSTSAAALSLLISEAWEPAGAGDELGIYELYILLRTPDASGRQMSVDLAARKVRPHSHLQHRGLL